MAHLYNYSYTEHSLLVICSTHVLYNLYSLYRHYIYTVHTCVLVHGGWHVWCEGRHEGGTHWYENLLHQLPRLSHTEQLDRERVMRLLKQLNSVIFPYPSLHLLYQHKNNTCVWEISLGSVTEKQISLQWYGSIGTVIWGDPKHHNVDCNHNFEMFPSYPPPQQPTCVWEGCWVLLPHGRLCACASLFLCTILGFGTRQTKLRTVSCTASTTLQYYNYSTYQII